MIGEGLQDVHDLGGKLAALLAIEGRAADDLIFAEQGHGEQRPVPEPDEGVPDAIRDMNDAPLEHRAAPHGPVHRE